MKADTRCLLAGRQTTFLNFVDEGVETLERRNVLEVQ